MRPEITKFGKISQNKAISPFKVTDFGTNRKLIYDFLSVINTNLLAILHRLQKYSLRNTNGVDPEGRLVAGGSKAKELTN